MWSILTLSRRLPGSSSCSSCSRSMSGTRSISSCIISMSRFECRLGNACLSRLGSSSGFRHLSSVKANSAHDSTASSPTATDVSTTSNAAKAKKMRAKSASAIDPSSRDPTLHTNNNGININSSNGNGNGNSNSNSYINSSSTSLKIKAPHVSVFRVIKELLDNAYQNKSTSSTKPALSSATTTPTSTSTTASGASDQFSRKDVNQTIERMLSDADIDYSGIQSLFHQIALDRTLYAFIDVTNLIKLSDVLASLSLVKKYTSDLILSMLIGDCYGKVFNNIKFPLLRDALSALGRNTFESVLVEACLNSSNLKTSTFNIISSLISKSSDYATAMNILHILNSSKQKKDLISPSAQRNFATLCFMKYTKAYSDFSTQAEIDAEHLAIEKFLCGMVCMRSSNDNIAIFCRQTMLLELFYFANRSHNNKDSSSSYNKYNNNNNNNNNNSNSSNSKSSNSSFENKDCLDLCLRIVDFMHHNQGKLVGNRVLNEAILVSARKMQLNKAKSYFTALEHEKQAFICISNGWIHPKLEFAEYKPAEPQTAQSSSPSSSPEMFSWNMYPSLIEKRLVSSKFSIKQASSLSFTVSIKDPAWGAETDSSVATSNSVANSSSSSGSSSGSNSSNSNSNEKGHNALSLEVIFGVNRHSLLSLLNGSIFGDAKSASWRQRTPFYTKVIEYYHSFLKERPYLINEVVVKRFMMLSQAQLSNGSVDEVHEIAIKDCLRTILSQCNINVLEANKLHLANFREGQRNGSFSRSFLKENVPISRATFSTPYTSTGRVDSSRQGKVYKSVVDLFDGSDHHHHDDTDMTMKAEEVIRRIKPFGDSSIGLDQVRASSRSHSEDSSSSSSSKVNASSASSSTSLSLLSNKSTANIVDICIYGRNSNSAVDMAKNAVFMRYFYIKMISIFRNCTHYCDNYLLQFTNNFLSLGADVQPDEVTIIMSALVKQKLFTDCVDLYKQLPYFGISSNEQHAHYMAEGVIGKRHLHTAVQMVRLLKDSSRKVYGMQFPLLIQYLLNLLMPLRPDGETFSRDLGDIKVGTDKDNIFNIIKEILPIVCKKCAEADEDVKTHIGKSICYLAINGTSFEFVEPLVAFCRSYEAPAVIAGVSGTGSGVVGVSANDAAVRDVIRGVAVYCDLQNELKTRQHKK